MTLSRRALSQLGVSAVFSASSCARSKSGAPARVELDFTAANDFLPAFVAKERGLFSSRGLQVELVRAPTAAPLPSALIGGSCQIAIGTPPNFLQACENGLDLVLVAGAAVETSARPASSVVRRLDLPLHDAPSFRGRKVGAPGLNASNHVMFQKWLHDRGVSPREVTYLEVPFAQMGDQLKAGQIDAALPVEPFRSRILDNREGELVANYWAEVRPLALRSFYMATRKWASESAGAIGAFREALREAERFIASDPAAARAIEAKYLGFDSSVVEKLPLALTSVAVAPADLQFWMDVTEELGMTRHRVAPESLLAK